MRRESVERKDEDENGKRDEKEEKEGKE